MGAVEDIVPIVVRRTCFVNAVNTLLRKKSARDYLAVVDTFAIFA